MTNDELQAHIMALWSAAQKGEIEWSENAGIWSPVTFGFMRSCNYRIKPKAREVWIAGDKLRMVADGDEWPFVPGNKNENGWVKFREVIDE